MSNWENIIAIKYCLKVTDGTHDSPKRKSIGKPLITSKHIKGRNIDFESAYFISEDDFNKINQRSQVDQWDVLISMIGEYCGFAYIERNNTIDYAVKNVGIFKTGNKIKAEWLYYYLTSPEGRNTLTTLRSGTSQPYISLGALRDLEIPMPDNKKKMELITSILSSLDDKIELNLQMNQTLETMAQAIFKEWFVNFNFPGFDGELVDGLPKGWRLGSILEIADLLSGGTPKTDINEYWNGNIKWISAKDITSNNRRFIIETEKQITELGISKSATKLLPKFTTIVSARGTVGNYCILPEEMAISQSNYGLKSKNNSDFFLFIFIENMIEMMKAYSYGTVFDTITTKTFEEMEVIIPSKSLIAEYEKTVNPIFSKILENQKQNQTLAQLRDSLLPKLMSGKIEVKA